RQESWFWILPIYCQSWVILKLSLTIYQSLSQIEVQSTRMDCKVASRFAHTVMTTKALNTANASQEVFFEVDLPKTAFITNFSMLVHLSLHNASGNILCEGKRAGRKMEKFSVSVNIAPQSSVTFTLTYEELLQRRLGSYEIMLGVRPKHRVSHPQIVVDIYEPKGIAFVDVNGTFITNELLPLVKKTVTDKKAHVYFSPTLEQQKSCSDCEDTLIDGDLLIRYDVNHPQDIESWRPFLSKATPENVTEAKEFVRTIKARHSKYES
uniref:Inter-alpha-trypsin inhibitor heavy chain 1 n=1 Tax=Sinocyclocheilus grahami TaxID=75366 RepID=A0A672M7B3_SINGR